MKRFKKVRQNSPSDELLQMLETFHYPSKERQELQRLLRDNSDNCFFFSSASIKHNALNFSTSRGFMTSFMRTVNKCQHLVR